ncbi:MAG: hypothetical protein U1E73_13585 [Planctomycetota bacterium]
MDHHPDRHLAVLAVLGDPRPMQALFAALREQAIDVDVATSLADARSAFFGAGGHDCLVLGPDVGRGLAVRIMHSLRAVDPNLPTASFGPDVREDTACSRTAALSAYHPGSRAGTGALLRFLTDLRH